MLIGSWIAGLGMPVTGIAAASLLVTLVGLVFGGLALLAGAATGRVRTAYGLASGLALATYLLNAFLPLNESLAGYARWSPFYYYLGGDPLSRGLDWGHAALLAGVFVALVAAATVAFGRRDLRLTG